MTLQQFLNPDESFSFDHDTFNAGNWLSYFIGNTTNRSEVELSPTIVLEKNQKDLISSWQRFQLGESGEGRFLTKFAATTNDADYAQSIELFVGEEKKHARLLADLLQSVKSTSVKWHWSASAFTTLRRMVGLKNEIAVFLIAEIIGKTFYKSCADHLHNKELKNLFSLLVMDKIFHLEFHTSFLRTNMVPKSTLVKQSVYYAWTLLFIAATAVFIADHRKSLSALNVTPQQFFHDCHATFKRTADRILL